MKRGLFKYKNSVALALLISAALMPSSANAVGPVYVTNFSQVTSVISSTSARIVTAVTAGATSIVNALLSMSSQTHADLERQNAFNKALNETAQNYDKQYKLQEHTADIESKYGSSDPTSQQQSDACEVIALGGNLSTAIANKRERSTALANDFLHNNTATEDPMTSARNTLKLHSDNFCSDEDKSRGRCSTVAPLDLQGADLKASNLFEPNETLTYGDKESLAAKEYISNLVSAAPTPALSKRAEATPAGRAYLAAQFTEQRKLDIAAHSLREIFASREEEPGLGTKVNMPTPNASVMGVIKHYASRFLDPAWTTSFGSMNEIDLLREQTRLMAFKTFMDYQSYMQGERTEAIVATLAIDQIKSNPSPDLNALRQKAQSRAQ